MEDFDLLSAVRPAGGWYAVVGITENTKQQELVETREELDKWEYVGDLMAHALEGVDIHEDVSCPDFFPLGGKWLLVCISHELGCRYYVGEWRDERFYPELHEQMSWVDNAFFAPESLLDPQGRRIMWAWVFDQRTPEAQLVRDADNLEMLIQLKEHHDVGNRNAEEWIPFTVRRLRSEAARELADAILKGDSSSWWFDRESDWWVRGGKG